MAWQPYCLRLRVRFSNCVLLLLSSLWVQANRAAAAVPEVPVLFQEGLLWVDVRIPQSDRPLNFLLDSGASVSVLNLAAIQQLGLKAGRRVSVSGVGTTVGGYWPVRLTAHAGRIELPDEFLALDLSRLSRACNRPVDGLIGADFFRDRVVEIDYAAEKLRLLDGPPSDAHAIPLNIGPCSLRIEVSVNGGISQWVRVDTGCATSFHWVTSTVSDERCTTRPTIGLAELSVPQGISNLRIGLHSWEGVATGLHRKVIFPGESGLLGNGILSSYGVVTIDAKSGRLFLGCRPPG